MPRAERYKKHLPSLGKRFEAWLRDTDLTALYQPIDAPAHEFAIDSIVVRYMKDGTKVQRATAIRNIRDKARQVAWSAILKAKIDLDRQDERERHLKRADEAEALADAIRKFLSKQGNDFDAHRLDFSDRTVTEDDELRATYEREALLQNGFSLSKMLDAFAKLRRGIPKGTRADRLEKHLKDNVTTAFPSDFGLPEDCPRRAIAEILVALKDDLSLPSLS